MPHWGLPSQGGPRLWHVWMGHWGEACDLERGQSPSASGCSNTPSRTPRAWLDPEGEVSLLLSQTPASPRGHLAAIAARSKVRELQPHPDPGPQPKASQPGSQLPHHFLTLGSMTQQQAL